MRKPDRFERMVAKGFPYKQIRPQDLIAARHAVGLLRRQHAAYRRMVKKVRNDMADTLDGSVGPLDDSWTGYRQACDDLLAALAQWKRAN